MPNEFQQTCKAFLRSWLAERNDLPEQAINVDEHLFNAGYLDSLGVFSFVLAIEQAFDLSLDEDDLIDPRMMTVSGIISLLAQKREGGSQAA